VLLGIFFIAWCGVLVGYGTTDEIKIIEPPPPRTCVASYENETVFGVQDYKIDEQNPQQISADDAIITNLINLSPPLLSLLLFLYLLPAIIYYLALSPPEVYSVQIEGYHLGGGGGGGEEEEDEEILKLAEKVPERYVIGCEGDRVEARRRYIKTLKWRRDDKVSERQLGAPLVAFE